ncbi:MULTISPECIES: hypothetical protein [Chromobacterium]|uniref:hypothetical protein n=1 Tax=Chromobacterium TaxID=535 RepID=UPI0011B20AE2|nr:MULTISPECIES: hypothetical protein [Chromobacterium]MCP1289112.1 hypothetical protein [Chromobacterium sp. S0633]
MKQVVHWSEKGKRLLPSAATLGRLVAALPWLALAGAAVWLGMTVAPILGPAAKQWRGLSEPAPQSAAANVAMAHWFGEPVAQQAAALPPVKLIGVYAPQASGAPGFAVIDDNGRSVALLLGKTTPDGWELAQITASGVLMRSGGSEQFVPLVERVPGAGGAVGGSAPPPMPPPISPPSQAPVSPPAVVPVNPETPPQPGLDSASMVRQ